jgi:glycine betaine/choline ABC-type transport system substrate-binding protein
MRLASLGVFALLGLMAAAAIGQQTGPKELLVGTWVMTEKKEAGELKATLVFDKDGNTRATLSVKATGTAGDPVQELTIDARYKWVGEDTIEMTTKPPGAKEEQTEKVRVKVSDKELLLSGKDGKDMKFTRSK